MYIFRTILESLWRPLQIPSGGLQPGFGERRVSSYAVQTGNSVENMVMEIWDAVEKRREGRRQKCSGVQNSRNIQDALQMRPSSLSFTCLKKSWAHSVLPVGQYAPGKHSSTTSVKTATLRGHGTSLSTRYFQRMLFYQFAPYKNVTR